MRRAKLQPVNLVASSLVLVLSTWIAELIAKTFLRIDFSSYFALITQALVSDRVRLVRSLQPTSDAVE